MCSVSGATELGSSSQSSSLRADRDAAAAAAELLPSSTSSPCFAPGSGKLLSSPISVPSHIRFYAHAEHDRHNVLRCSPTKVRAALMHTRSVILVYVDTWTRVGMQYACYGYVFYIDCCSVIFTDESKRPVQAPRV